MVEDVDFGELAEELERRFGDGSSPWSDESFGALALRVFACQFEHMPTYRAFCESRDRTPATVERWQDVPAVPARAFKHIDFSVAEPELVFLTSGTTFGSGRRGRHLVPRASLYRRSLLPPFVTHVLAGGQETRLPFLSLIPSHEAQPSSSLSFMATAAAATLATQTHWVVDGVGALDEAGLRAAMREAARAGGPVVVLGTALALLRCAERLEGAPADPLPAGSRIMETGGFKGFSRSIGRAELYGRVSESTGVPGDHIVSEYGMTELLSQLYTPVLTEGPDAAATHVGPPWLRARALDPATLDEVELGEAGLLAFFDLANAGSVCHVLTEDVGSVVDGRVLLRGRVDGAEPRGCSRAMDQLMSAAGSAS